MNWKWIYTIVAVIASCYYSSGVPYAVIDGEEFRFRESVIPTDYHKYYLSVSNVKYSPKAKALQMTSRFFVDDLQDVLTARFNRKVAVGNSMELKELLPVLQQYLSKRLDMKVDGSHKEPVVIGAEYDADQIIIYLEIPSMQQPKEIQVSFKALFELFPEQKNLIHFKIGDQRKSLLSSVNTPIDQVNF